MSNIAYECANEIIKQIFPRTFPISVKLLKKGEAIPSDAIRPKKDLGYRLSLCQGFSILRREGKTIAMFKEDMWCPEAIIGLGLCEPPDEFLDGRMWVGERVVGQTKEITYAFKDLEACKNYGNSLPRFEPGTYVGVVFGPALKVDFDPDVILVYGDAAQIRRLVVGIMYNNGKPITGTFYGGACLRTIVQAVKTGKCQITVPCVPEYDMSQDDELIFAIPKEEMKNLITGLRCSQDKMLPTNFMLPPEHPLPPGYMRVREKLGVNQKLYKNNK